MSEHTPHTHDGHHHGEQTEAAALLGYLIEHNRHHAQELRELAAEVAQGCPQAARLLEEAVADFVSGTDKLSLASDKLKAEE